MNSNTDDDMPIVGGESGLVADRISSAAAAGERSENTNSSTSRVSSTRKRSFNILDGNDDSNTSAVTAESSTYNKDNQDSSHTIIQQQKISDTMQTNFELKTNYN